MVLSSAFMYATNKEASELDSHYDALLAVLSSIPEELYHEIELEVHSAEGAATNKQRLEVFKEQQELIEEENEQRSEGSTPSAPYYDRDIDEKVADILAASPNDTPGDVEIASAVKEAEAVVKEENEKRKA